MHLIQCQVRLKKVLKLPNLSKIEWTLRSSIITRTPKFLHLCLRKSFLNFASTAYQLHRQKMHSSPICRFCLIEPELDTLCVLDCKHELLLDLKRDLLVQLQQDVLKLTDDGLTRLMSLESMFQPELTPFPNVPPFINN